MSDTSYLSPDEREAKKRPVHAEAVIAGATAEVAPPLLPELRLHLVTPAQAWWRAAPEDLLEVGVIDPYWAFCWPGGVALARYLLDQPELVRGLRVYDLGSGSGVVAIAAAVAGAASVVANDIDGWALSACALNAELNNTRLSLSATDLIGEPLTACDVLLIGDTSYSKELVARLWPWLEALAAQGVKVLLADPGRGFLPPDLAAKARLRVPAEVDASGDHWVYVDIIEVGAHLYSHHLLNG